MTLAGRESNTPGNQEKPTPKKVGRPATGRTTVSVAARITLDEYATLVDLAQKQEIPVSEWVRRQLVIGGRGLRRTKANRRGVKLG